MSLNIGFFISKFFSLLIPPATRGCSLGHKVNLSSGCYCVNTIIGRYSYLGRKSITVNAQIGSFCSIASLCCIGGGNHPSSFFSTSPLFYNGKNAFNKHYSHYNFEEAKPVVIGNDVWIGEKVFIKDGLTIGNGAIIGAHSVVTHNVPPYAIVGGVPAKLIRYRFDNDVIEKLEELQWWNFDDEKLKRFAEKLENKELSIDSLNYATSSDKL